MTSTKEGTLRGEGPDPTTGELHVFGTMTGKGWSEMVRENYHVGAKSRTLYSALQEQKVTWAALKSEQKKRNER